jgi:hypothetical protein
MTWPSWEANSEPPTVRMSRPAPCTRLCISSGCLVAQRLGERVGDAGRHGLGELLPHGQGRLDPSAAGQCARWYREL